MVQMFLFPIIFVLFGICAMCLFIGPTIVWTMSIGKIVEFDDDDIPGGEAKMLVFTEEEKYLLTFTALMFIWWMAFLITISEFIFTFSVCIWYFCREKANIYRPLWRALKLCFRYHIGSVVLASLLYFTFSIPRKIVKPLFGRLKRAKQTKAIKCLTDCCCCCLEMHEVLFKYLSPSAITYLSLFGDNFMTSARRGYFLMQRNKARVGISTRSGSFVVSIMKLTITLSGTVFCYGWLLYKEKTLSDQLTIELVTATGPALVTFICCVFVGYVFGGVFGACLHTVAGCASADEEMFTNEQRFMEEDLQDFLDLVDEAARDPKQLKARGGKVAPKAYADDADLEDMEYVSEKAQLKPSDFPEHTISINKGVGLNTDRSYAAGILSTARSIGFMGEDEEAKELQDQEDLFTQPIIDRSGDHTRSGIIRSQRALQAPAGISGLSEIRGEGELQMYRANNFYSPSVMTSQIAFQVPETDFDMVDDEKPMFQ